GELSLGGGLAVEARRAADEDVVGVAAAELVGAVAADEDVASVAATERVVTGLSEEHVATPGAAEGVVAVAGVDVATVGQPARVDDVVAVAGIDDNPAGGGKDTGVDAGDRHQHLPAVLRLLDPNVVRVGRPGDEQISLAAVDRVGDRRRP